MKPTQMSSFPPSSRKSLNLCGAVRSAGRVLEGQRVSRAGFLFAALILRNFKAIKGSNIRVMSASLLFSWDSGKSVTSGYSKRLGLLSDRSKPEAQYCSFIYLFFPFF